jgi:acyl-CoA hydrolase
MTQWDLTPRPSTESETVLVELMTSEDANILGTVHGGTVMKLVDTAAGLAAIRHCGGVAVTASIDQMSFHAPVRVGNLLHVRACVNDAGRTSMEVGVRVEAEDIVTGRRRHTASAYVVMVAIDSEGSPRPVPAVVPGDEAARRRQQEARLRREARLRHERSIESLRAEPSNDGADPAEASGDGTGSVLDRASEGSA